MRTVEHLFTANWWSSPAESVRIGMPVASFNHNPFDAVASDE
jgi:hypothetical protein